MATEPIRRVVSVSQPFLAALAIYVIVGLFPSASAADSRNALVIGNSDYSVSPLLNPLNDAFDVSSALRDVGFDVRLKTDATRPEMLSAIAKFGERVEKEGGVGLFYFAGHAVERAGRNYLLPVDADGPEILQELVPLTEVLSAIENASNDLNIIILDACRTDPRREAVYASRGVKVVRKEEWLASGLASVDAPANTLIAFATSPGSVALDGSGRNGAYTAELVKVIRLPNLPVERLFKMTRLAVMRKTENQQTPWETSSLTTEFQFVSVPRTDEDNSLSREQLDEEGEALFTIGASFGRQLSTIDPTEGDIEALELGLRYAISGLSGGEGIDVTKGAKEKVRRLVKHRTRKSLERESAAAERYLEQRASEPGSRTSDSGIVWQSMKSGSGRSPRVNDTVRVHYHGTLRNGLVFDSSVERGPPAQFPLTKVIPCWTEMLTRMREGEKARFTCPSRLAYGDRAQGSIPAGAALTFEVELLSIVE